MQCRLLLYLFLDYHLGYTNGVAMVRGACQWPKENPAMNADRDSIPVALGYVLSGNGDCRYI